MYIGGGGSGGSAPGSPVAGGRGGGGRGTSGLNYAQSASGTLAPLADVPQFHGLDFSGGGGGGWMILSVTQEMVILSECHLELMVVEVKVL